MIRSIVKGQKPSKVRDLTPPPLTLTYLVGYFDGVSQLSNSVSGPNIVLYISPTHSFHLWMGCDPDTNTRSEIIALAGLRFFSIHKDIYSLQAFGDSNIIVD